MTQVWLHHCQGKRERERKRHVTIVRESITLRQLTHESRRGDRKGEVEFSHPRELQALKIEEGGEATQNKFGIWKSKQGVFLKSTDVVSTTRPFTSSTCRSVKPPALCRAWSSNNDSRIGIDPVEVKNVKLHETVSSIFFTNMLIKKLSRVCPKKWIIKDISRTLFQEGQVFALGPSVAIVAQASRLKWLFVFFTSTTAFACSRPLFRTYSHARAASVAADHAAGIVAHLEHKFSIFEQF